VCGVWVMVGLPVFRKCTPRCIHPEAPIPGKVYALKMMFNNEHSKTTAVQEA
jgi:hypothetical protein